MNQQFEEASAAEAGRYRRDRLTVAFVASLVALVTDVPVSEILARRRTTAAAVRARQTAIYLVHTALGWPLRRAADAFGRDRTTAGHAVQQIEDLRDDASFDTRLSIMEACLLQVIEPGVTA